MRVALAVLGLSCTVPALAAQAGPDAAVGLWGGAIGAKIEGGTIDSFVVGIDKASDGSGYGAVSRVDVTLASDSGTTSVVVITTYKGKAAGDSILFESTERKRIIDGGAPELLVQAFMRVTPKPGHIEAHVGSDTEGYTDFTLVPKPGQ